MSHTCHVEGSKLIALGCSGGESFFLMVVESFASLEGCVAKLAGFLSPHQALMPLQALGVLHRLCKPSGCSDKEGVPA